MTTTTPAAPPPHSPAAAAGAPPALGVARRCFTVAEYYAMGRAGILSANDRVELLDGELIQMPPIGDWHNGKVNWLNHRLAPLGLAQRAIVQTQGPLRLDYRSEPQPDLMLLRFRADFYQSGKPTPADVLLLIEVSDTTAAYDQGLKLAAYARAGIPEVWLVSRNDRRITAATEPAGGAYTVIRHFAAGDAIAPRAFPDLALPVDGIIGG